VLRLSRDLRPRPHQCQQVSEAVLQLHRTSVLKVYSCVTLSDTLITNFSTGASPEPT
jgi:hypothetical protein